MSGQEPQQSKYGFSKTVDLPYEEAVEKTRAALNEEGFGVLSEIDIKEKLKDTLGVDFRNARAIRLSHTGLCKQSSTSGCSFPAMSSFMKLTGQEHL